MLKCLCKILSLCARIAHYTTAVVGNFFSNVFYSHADKYAVQDSFVYTMCSNAVCSGPCKLPRNIMALLN